VTSACESILERATSTSRSTIRYSVRDGLLPAAQKAAASRRVSARLESYRELIDRLVEADPPVPRVDKA